MSDERTQTDHSPLRTKSPDMNATTVSAKNRHTSTQNELLGQAHHDRYPTTSFLTATTLIYACGAGITAAAGTRLSLHWILVKVFKLYSFQLAEL